MHNWGFLIVVYLFLGGVGAGAFIASYLAQKNIIKASKSFIKAGYLLSAPCIIIGSVLLYFDLGTAFSDPLAVLYMFRNFSSVMTWGIYILSLFCIVGIAAGYYAYKELNVPSVLSLLGVLLAFGTAGYTGVLLMVSTGVPFWNSSLLSMLFIVSALSTGMAANSLLAYFVSDQNTDNQGKAHLFLVVFEFIFIVLFIGSMLLKNGSSAVSANMVVFSELAPVFWLFCIGCAIVFPILCHFVLKNLKLLDEISVLIGGFGLRAVVVFAAVPAWMI